MPDWICNFAPGEAVPIPTLPLLVARKEFPLTVSVVANKFVIVADAEVSVVMLAEAILRLLSVKLVALRLVIVAEVYVAVVPETVVMLADVLVRVVMVAEVDCN